MSTRRIATALGTVVLLLGAPATYALAGQDRPGKPDKPGGVHECEDGVDNDGDNQIDFSGGDADCESPRDNSEGPEEAEEPGGPGAVNGPVRELIGTVKDTLFPEEPPAEEPCEGPDCPGEEPPAEDPLAPVIAAVEDVIGQLPPPPAPPTQEELEAAVADVVGQLPPPPAP